MPRSDLLAVDLPAFGKWMLTLAVSIFVVGAASTGTLNLVSNYTVRPATAIAAPTPPAALRSVEPIRIVTPAAAEEVPPASSAPAGTRDIAAPDAGPAAAAERPVAAAETAGVPAQEAAALRETASGGPRMMATLGLAVRARPETASAQVGALQQGEIVSIEGEDGGWYRVTTRSGRSGWSWGRYLRPVDPKVAADSPFWAANGEEVAFAR